MIAYQVTGGKVYLTAFNVERGSLSNKQEFTFDAGEDFFEEFLVQYYSEREPPAELILEHETGPALAEFLSLKKGKHVDVIVPQRGEKRQLLDLAKKNLEIAFFRDTLKGAEPWHRPPHGTSPLRDRVLRYLAPLRDRDGRLNGAVPGRQARQEQLPAL